jgi:hypothetical protein
VWGTLEEQVAADLSAYSFQELAAALAQRGQRRRGRKEDLVAQLTQLVVQVGGGWGVGVWGGVQGVRGEAAGWLPGCLACLLACYRMRGGAGGRLAALRRAPCCVWWRCWRSWQLRRAVAWVGHLLCAGLGPLHWCLRLSSNRLLRQGLGAGCCCASLLRCSCRPSLTPSRSSPYQG